ncbi:DUF7696 family protein [Microvirga roseola]|uniref:DUF7696 family protein n=1 Tax=Microvirga roseola TaxID=2883126 RepID=UPI001E2D273F|nr:hypothetical protein [Microvirga roseola]
MSFDDIPDSTYSRDTTAISQLTAQPVSTWSEEWRVETEARAVLAMSNEQRDAFFNGRKDADGKTIDRGVIGIRGLKAAEEIKATVEKLQAARARRA